MKFPLWATILTLLGVTVLCGLGGWQLQRLEWKNSLIEKLDAEYAREAHEFSTDDLKNDFFLKHARLHGVYDHHKEIKVGPRMRGAASGFYLLTPFHLRSGGWVLVNRGWVPGGWPLGNETSSGEITLTGILRKPQDRNAFTPDNRPAKNEWFYIDTAAIKDAKNLSDLSAYVLYLEPGGGPETGEYPEPIDPRPALKNDHLQYAFFWFTMAGILLVIYALRFLKKAR